MKKTLLLLPLLLLFSCSVEKRKYQKGYHVNWNKSGNISKEKRDPVTKAPEVKKEQPQQEIVAPSYPDQELTGSADDKIVPVEVKKKKSPLIGDEPCDDLIFKDGSEIKGKVLEITTTEIKYKKCEMLDGPTYVAKKSDMFMIKYSNGTREVFKDQPTPNNQSQPRTNNNRPTTVHPMAIGSLVFGILSIVPFYTAPIFAILAIVLGNKAINRINAQPDIYKGEGMAIAGKTIGTIVGGIYLIALVIIIIALILFL